MNNFVYKTDFLNSLFVEKDFKFIDSIDKELQNLNNQINTQTEKREYIVKFINNINTYLEQNDSSIENHKMSELHTNASKILERVNENINLLNSLESTLKTLNQTIINFLIYVDSNKEEDYKDNIQLQEIKNSINNYSNILTDANEKILLNDIKIYYFTENSISKNFLTDFSLSSDNSSIYDTTEEIDTSISTSSTILDESVSEQVSFEDNYTLVISEIRNEVILPYKVSEINEYINQFPTSYNSFEDVVKKEFVLPLDYYMKHPVIARFRETYSLIRDREVKSIVEALKYAIDLMFKYELNPAIIAACKTQEQLENYLECLESNKLDNFKDFKIKFEINPL